MIPMNYIFDAIKEERNYQDSLPNHTVEQDEHHSIADWIIFMEYQLKLAKDAVYMLDRERAMHAIRKVSALGIACMQHNGAYTRQTEQGP